MTTLLAEIGSSRIVAAVVLGVPLAIGILFLLWAVPKRVGVVQPLGSLVVVGLLGLGLWAAFSSSPPAATSSSSVPAGGPQFSPVGPSPSPASPQPTASRSPGPSPSAPGCKPSDSTRLSVTAAVGASVNGFAQTCLAVQAERDFKVTFKNEDTGVAHTWALFKDPSAAQRLGGAASATDSITGPSEKTYQLKALPAGTYFFRCDIHPTLMTGTFVVS